MWQRSGANRLKVVADEGRTEIKAIHRVAPLLLVLGGLLVVGLLAACGGQTPGTEAVATPIPHPASSEEIEMVRHALITDVTSINTSHRVVSVTYSSPDQQSASGSSQFEADVRAPDTVYAKGNFNGTEFERLLVGDKLHRKDANGQWVQYSESDDSYLALYYALDLPYQGLEQSLVAGESPGIEGLESPTVIDTGGEVVLDGRSTKHYTWELSFEPAGGQKQHLTNEVWIDPMEKRTYKLLQCTHREAKDSIPSSDGCISVTISKVNEPMPSLP